MNAVASRKVIVLDDDPTGTQTVHGVPVLTEWSIKSLTREFENDLPAAFVLTNTRAMSPSMARMVNLEIGRNLLEASRRAGREFVVISRSDSTLRGHFPLELEALEEALETVFDAWLICPFFEAGGRVTIGDVHYVRDGDELVPAGETEFARDATFGYCTSNLREWVEEKTNGRVRAEEVRSISLEDIRQGRTLERLLELPRHAICIVNAELQSDLEAFVAGLLEAESRGKRYLYRTAASFAAVRAGITPRALLTRDDLELPGSGGGLIVVGSYIEKSSDQLAHLLELPDLEPVEVSVEAVLSDQFRDGEIGRASRAAESALEGGLDAVVFTSRERVRAGDLDVGERVSSTLVEIVRRVSVRPRYVLAKGGITSSDTATQALEVRRAMVLGQIAPGVPVWRLGDESHWPGTAYIVFPGNVGGPGTLAGVVKMLRHDGP